MSLDTVWRVYYRMMKPQIGRLCASLQPVNTDILSFVVAVLADEKGSCFVLARPVNGKI